MQQNVSTSSTFKDPASLTITDGLHLVDVEVGKRIKKRRQQLRISQTALGAAVGVSFQQIQKYERGSNRVSSSALYSLAQVLDVPVAYFFETLSRPIRIDCAELERKAALREDFVATEEGQRLVDAFMTIPKKMRPKFISLLATFSNEP
ncbi:helix-turn-helix domain-containing protein [Rhizobium sp. BK661]|uniref:helix-turn-helix domain-containing protein n=1 Tax=Rhizobium sp. BK661 TaxID=2586991 RepID=UPI00216A8FA8|nr:helix-turn-helix transcriptional regulator [Rhizobium sp. BK661]MCS3743633.1 transcriptional regulator with XRE-family HTH domain [Rhizobium sp. BK661]